MRRWIWAVCLTCIMVAPAAAEITKQAGVIAGFNFSTLKISGQDTPDGRSAFAAGGVLDLGFNDRFGLRIEPVYIRNGAKAQNRNAYWGTMDGAFFKIDYIGLPVLARYDLGSGARHPYLLGGLSANFATSSKVELTQGQDRATVDFSDVFNPLDLTLDLGGGINFEAGANRATLDARISIGLLDINDGGTVTFNGAPLAVPSTSTHSMAVRVFASYLFNL